MKLSPNLGRGLVVLALFVAHRAKADPAPDVDLSLGDFEDTVVVGVDKDIDITMTSSTANPPQTVCSDDFEGEGGWGCSGGKSCGSWTTEETPPSVRTTFPKLASASCDEGCTVTILQALPARIRIHADKAGSFTLHLSFSNSARGAFDRSYPIEAVPTTLRLGRAVRSEDAQSRRLVLLIAP